MSRFSARVCGPPAALQTVRGGRWGLTVTGSFSDRAEMFVSPLAERERKVHPSHLLSRGSGEDEGGEHREGVFGVCWPALDRGPHREAEERNGLRQWKGLVVLLWISAE